MSAQSEKNLEWMDSCVSEWGITRVKSLFADSADSISTAEMEPIEVDHYSIPAFDSSGTPSVEDGASIDSNKKRLKGGELLFSKLNSHKPRVWLVPEDGDRVKVCSTEFLTLLPWPSANVSKAFFAYLLSSKALIDYITCFQTAVTNSHRRIKPRNLLQTHTILPPLPEQKRIVAYLDTSCAAIDRAVETKQKQLETLDALRKSIIQRAVTQGLNAKVKMKDSGVDWLGQVPEHWLCESLKRATSRIQTGSTPPTSQPEYYEEGTIEWYAPECFGQTINLRAPKKLINQQAFEDNKVRIFAPETVLFVGIGATIGKVAILEKEGSANQQIVGISCDHRMIGRFLAYQLKNYETIIPRIAQYTTLPILNQTKVGYLPVLRPPISEQNEVCDFLDNKELELAKVEKSLYAQLATLNAYRKSLIHECVTGKRRISDAVVAKVGAHV